jgi:hypothetical protein
MRIIIKYLKFMSNKILIYKKKLKFEWIPNRYQWMSNACEHVNDRITKIVIKLIALNLIVIKVIIAINNKSPHNETNDKLIIRSFHS